MTEKRKSKLEIGDILIRKAIQAGQKCPLRGISEDGERNAKPIFIFDGFSVENDGMGKMFVNDGLDNFKILESMEEMI